MTTIEPRPQTLADQIAAVETAMNEALDVSIASGDLGAVVGGLGDVYALRNLARRLEAAHETAVLEMLPDPPEDFKPAPAVPIGDFQYRKVRVFKSDVWHAPQILAEVVGSHEDDIAKASKIVADLLLVLPGKPTFRSGDKGGNYGLTALDLSARDFRDPQEQSGWKLETKRVTP